MQIRLFKDRIEVYGITPEIFAHIRDKPVYYRLEYQPPDQEDSGYYIIKNPTYQEFYTLSVYVKSII